VRYGGRSASDLILTAGLVYGISITEKGVIASSDQRGATFTVGNPFSRSVVGWATLCNQAVSVRILIYTTTLARAYQKTREKMSSRISMNEQLCVGIDMQLSPKIA
jgi:hypothetical protein